MDAEVERHTYPPNSCCMTLKPCYSYRLSWLCPESNPKWPYDAVDAQTRALPTELSWHVFICHSTYVSNIATYHNQTVTDNRLDNRVITIKVYQFDCDHIIKLESFNYSDTWIIFHLPVSSLLLTNSVLSLHLRHHHVVHELLSIFALKNRAIWVDKYAKKKIIKQPGQALQPSSSVKCNISQAHVSMKSLRSIAAIRDKSQ